MNLHTTTEKAKIKAYKIVLKELKSSARCKDEDYAIGCFECAVRRLYKDLESFYESYILWMNKDSK